MKNPAIQSLLDRYQVAASDDKIRILRDVFQHLTLLALWRSKFFEHAAFYGGTALRILHGLDRFSEDLDFSLLKADPAFNMSDYNSFIINELEFYGFSATITPREKSVDSQVKSAFLKADTLQQWLVIEPGFNEPLPGLLPVLKIKIEADTIPPMDFNTEVINMVIPIPFSIKSFDLPSLFAGKLHALLFREWRSRVKGRDWYDFIWFISRSVPVNLKHLESRMRQNGDFKETGVLTLAHLHKLLEDRIDTLNVDMAREDVSRFIASENQTEIWSTGFFKDIARRITI